MITALALGGYAVLVGFGAPRLLPRLWHACRAPRRTVALLLILAYSLPLSAITGGIALGVTLLDALARIDPTVDACADQLPINDETPVAPLLGAIGLGVAGLLAARILFCLLSTMVAARIRRRAHSDVLRLAGRDDRTLNATVLDHAQPASYCLPGRRGRIVVTTKAIQLLTADQLGAVLAHERAHLRGHHHLLLTLAASLRRAVPGVRLVAYCDREVRRLVELIADDAAARDHGRLTVATALAVIGSGHVPGGALGVADDGPEALARISRLSRPAVAMSRRGTVFSLAVVAASIAVPLTLALGSIGVLMRHCPPSTDDESPGSTIVSVR
jgi:Zn-dependent protease with chaperone function